MNNQLQEAAKNGDVLGCHQLITSNADVNSTDHKVGSARTWRVTRPGVGWTLGSPSRGCSRRWFSVLTPKQGWTPLHAAADNDAGNTCALLLRHNAEVDALSKVGPQRGWPRAFSPRLAEAPVLLTARLRRPSAPPSTSQ